MIRIPGRIPISIHPLFWLIAGVIGFLYSPSFWGILLWMLIIFVSVLFHEYGHALTAYFFGQHPQIELIPMGGRTSYEGKNLRFWQQFLIVLDGPLFGMLLFLIATLLLKWKLFQNPLIVFFLEKLQFVNLFWTIINLLPIIPLDGGQLLRVALEGFFGVKGLKASILIGMIFAFGISFYFFLTHWFLIGAVFFLFAFQSFDLFRRSKYLTSSDRKEEYTEEFKQAEMALQKGQIQQAKDLFELIRKQTKKGILFVAATQYLAKILYDEQERHEAYTLLLSIKDFVEDQLLVIFHELAFEEENYPLVVSLSSSCFQQMPTQEVALKNARAFGMLKEAKPAGGWLATALQYGKLNIEEIIKEKFFHSVQSDPAFLSFFQKQ